MNYLKISLILFLGFMGIFFEFSNTLEMSILPIDSLIKWILLIILIIVFIRYTFKDIKQYQQTALLNSFIYSALSLFFLLLIFGHRYFRNRNDQSASLVKAEYGFKKDGHESIYFDFKTNGHIRIAAMYKFSETYYWGDYTKSGDTLLLDIPDIPNISNKAFFKNDTFYFIGDTTRYRITDYYPEIY